MECCEQTLKLKLFKFPHKEGKFYSTWVENCGLSADDENKKCKYLCEKHFHSQDVFKNKLRKDAIPLFHLFKSSIVKSVHPENNLDMPTYSVKPPLRNFP